MNAEVLHHKSCVTKPRYLKYATVGHEYLENLSDMQIHNVYIQHNLQYEVPLKFLVMMLVFNLGMVHWDILGENIICVQNEGDKIQTKEIK